MMEYKNGGYESGERPVYRPQRLWNSFLVLSLILVYGSSLLLGQINQLYYNHKNTGALKHKPASPIVPEGKLPLTFQALRNGTFAPERKSIQWLRTDKSLNEDSGEYIVVDDGNYVLKSLTGSEERSLFSGTSVEYGDQTFKVEDVVFSDNLKHALIVCNKVKNWRHSFFATYFILDVESQTTSPLYDGDSLVALAKWSPDSSSVAFIVDNNVYVKDLVSKTVHQVTTEGGTEIFYGKPDWVYEEEVFEGDTSMWWSPNSEFLTILRFNDTLVPKFPIPYFVQHDDDIYPELRELKYPKPGYSNPKVDFVVYDAKNAKLTSLDSSDPFYNDEDIPNDERLITEVKWVGDTRFLLKITNRESDILKFFIVDASTMESLLRRSDFGGHTNSWFEISHNLLYVPKSDTRPEDGYIDIIDVDGYDHLAYFSPPETQTPLVLTSGEWEVVDGAAAFDSVTNKIYFISTEKSSVERHLYSINLDGSNKTSITNVEEKGWHSVSFSAGSRFLLLNYDGPGVPHQRLLDLHANTEESFTTNEKLLSVLEQYAIPSRTFGEVDVGVEQKLNYHETLPVNFDPSKKYPLLFFVYGGPGSQLVQNTFSVSFSAIVAAELDAVVVTVDGRGTGFKGKAFRNIVRDNLGHYEVIDQLATAKQWVSKPYIDEERTAIWGWSYGGYMTLKTLEADKGNIFKYGMSVAPVTNWRLYDSVYTERYMHTPQQNSGYYNSSVHEIANFSGVKRFLLMHGTGDDNVHFQNSLKFLDMLDLEGLENYDVHVFPDSDHSISYHNANRIVYDKLLNWLKKNWT
ncbi:hypothetical protein OGAPHI_005802 [Ogataea philodendri]|uniref:Dipeptidyl aminopeptidase B n=1 Tax=Ogataea philodendri TaxID=1378263 RepID=A0A9P8NZH0_9ASCO|nr:uncharacterized protein OGAPHI_005802 [Ogataea philodendri]KAH3662550.1 hypothetical protein OGAPHI_005802 [Ogataea philodendri]